MIEMETPSRTQRYGRARLAAVNKLIEAHPEEFKKLFDAELEAHGWEPKPDGAWGVYRRGRVTQSEREADE